MSDDHREPRTESDAADRASDAWRAYQDCCADWSPKDERETFYRLARDAEDRLWRAEAREKALARKSQAA